MILVFGSINLDFIFELERLPEEGDTIIGPAARMEPGGKGANQAVAAARDGAQVVMAGAVGHDHLARHALAALEAEGVDIARVARVDHLTGIASVCVDREGRSQSALASGANLFAHNEQVEERLLSPDITLLLQMECDADQVATMIRRGRARGCRIILNLAPPGPLDLRVLRDVDVIVANATEAAWLGSHLHTGANAASLHAALGNGIVVTRGSLGADCYTVSGYRRVEATKIEVRDTTGSGDCFVGVLAAALDRGAGMAEAMRRANLAAGLACTRVGTQVGLPSGFEIDTRMAMAPEVKDAPPTVRD